MNKFLNFIRKFYIYLILLIIYIPLIFVVFLSFTDPSLKGNVNNNFEWNDGSNYLNLFTNNEFLNALLNTFIIVIIVVPISTIIATLTSFGIWNAKSFYVNSILGISKINMAIPDVLTGISLTILFSVTFIPLGFNLGFLTVILAHISFCTPYGIMIIYPRMMKMNKNLINASIDLGYSKIKTFFKITIPYLMPSILVAVAMIFSMSFDDFIITKLVGGKVSTISTEMYSMAKGIKMWAVTFGAILVFITFGIVGVIAIKKTIAYKKENKIINKRKYKTWLNQ